MPGMDEGQLTIQVQTVSLLLNPGDDDHDPYQLLQRRLFALWSHPRLVAGVHVGLVLWLRWVVAVPVVPGAPARRGRGRVHGGGVVSGRVLWHVVLDWHPVAVGGEDLRPEDAPL